MIHPLCTRFHVVVDENSYATISSFGFHHLWKSINKGVTWAAVGANLPDIPTWDIYVAPSALYLGTDIGMFASYDDGRQHNNT